MTDSEFLYHEACPKCDSKDNAARYSDGHVTCFTPGCDFYEKGDTSVDWGNIAPTPRPPQAMLEGSFARLAKRKIEQETARKFRYAIGHHRGRNCQIASFADANGALVAQKVRFADKTFTWLGEPKRAALFGQQLWGAGGRRVVVTEGEIDAMALGQVMGLSWPVVSIRNGADGAAKDLAANIEWLESFEEVVLCFDSDEPGQMAARDCAQLFSPGKCKIAHLELKDAGEMLLAGKTKKLVSSIWNASPYRPDGIVSGIELMDAVLLPPPPSTPYPWDSLNEMLRGQRSGEITTWLAGTGTGKSQVTRELAYALHGAGDPVGVIALEESTRKAALAQVSIEMGVRLHEPSVRAEVGDAAIREAATRALKNIHFYEHFGSVDVDVLIPKIRFMAKSLGVKWVLLDHISIMVSGNATEGDERKRIDELMTKLRTSVESLGVGLHVVCHLRKAQQGKPFEEGGKISVDDARGSGAIKQVSDNIVALERNQQAEDVEERNTTLVRVLKCREFGETGVAGYLLYDSSSGRIHETTPPEKMGESFKGQKAATDYGDQKDEF